MAKTAWSACRRFRESKCNGSYLMRQLGGSWKRWTKEQKAECRKRIEPIIDFDRRLSDGKESDLA